MADLIYLDSGSISSRLTKQPQAELAKASRLLLELNSYGAMQNASYVIDGVKMYIFSGLGDQAGVLSNRADKLLGMLEQYAALIDSGPAALIEQDASVKGKYTNGWQRFWHGVSDRAASLWGTTTNFFNNLFSEKKNQTSSVTEIETNRTIENTSTQPETTFTLFTQDSVRDYQDGVQRGNIRYVNQNPNYKSEETGWGEGDYDISGQCNWACESMAFSYIGIDIPPSTMHSSDRNKSFELALGFTDGTTDVFDTVDGEQATVEVRGGWCYGSFERNKLDDYVKNFTDDGGEGNSSPVMLHYSDGSNMHWILITGKNDDGSYRAIGPWSNDGSDYERQTFTVNISDAGVVSGEGFSGCGEGRIVDCIGQYIRKN